MNSPVAVPPDTISRPAVSTPPLTAAPDMTISRPPETNEKSAVPPGKTYSVWPVMAVKPLAVPLVAEMIAPDETTTTPVVITSDPACASNAGYWAPGNRMRVAPLSIVAPPIVPPDDTIAKPPLSTVRPLALPPDNTTSSPPPPIMSPSATPLDRTVTEPPPLTTV